LYPEGEGVQLIRELRICSEVFITSLIKRFSETYKFTIEESKNLREYLTTVRGVISDDYSKVDQYYEGLSKLVEGKYKDSFPMPFLHKQAQKLEQVQPQPLKASMEKLNT